MEGSVEKGRMLAGAPKLETVGLGGLFDDRRVFACWIWLGRVF